MRVSKRAMLAAGLIAGAAALTGCTVNTTPAATLTPKAAGATAQPATEKPSASPQAAESTAESETSAPLSLTVDGKEIKAHAMEENGRLLLPLVETAQALGWKTDSEQSKTENGEKQVVSLEKDGSRITVNWTVSDNTIKGVSWQQDGLLIPVDGYLTTKAETVYAPAAFFEEGMAVQVIRTETGVVIEPAAPKDTPDTNTKDVGENG